MAAAVWLMCVVLCAVAAGQVEGGIVKRSDDSSPLETMLSNLASDVSTLKAQLTAKEAEIQQVKNDLQLLKDQAAHKVVFSAYVSEDHLNESSRGVIKFSGVLTNNGKAYNANTGTFTAPHDGLYFFLATVDVSVDYSSLSIKKNGHTVAYGHNDGNASSHVVASCTLKLEAGDTVTVNHAGAVLGSVDGGPESMFVGFEI